MHNRDYIVNYCKKNFKYEIEKSISLCDSILNNEFYFDMPWDLEAYSKKIKFDDKIEWRKAPNLDPEFIWQFNRHRFGISLAQVYAITGEKKYLDKFVSLISSWIDEIKFEDEKKLLLKKAWRELEVGFRASAWIEALEIFGDDLPKEFLSKIETSLCEHEKILIQCTAPRLSLSNWGVIENAGLISIACYFKAKDEHKKSFDIAYQRLQTLVNSSLLGDFVHWEASPMYHMEVVNCLCEAIVAARKIGVELDEEFTKRVNKSARSLMLMMKPDRKMPMCGDSDHMDLSTKMAKYALIFEDGELKSMASETLDFESVWIFGEEGINKFEEIQIQPCSQIVSFMSDSGNYILRTDFSKKANYLHFFNAYTSGHAHCDKLHFDLSIEGKDFLVDSGRYTYKELSLSRRKFKFASSHNTSTINHRQFIVPKMSFDFLSLAQSMAMPCEDTAEVSVLRSAHLGYIKLINGAVVKRTIVWLKPSIYLVLDEFIVKGINSFQRYFNFSPEASLSMEKDKLIAKNGETEIAMYFEKMSKVKIKKSWVSPMYNTKVQSKKAIENSIGSGFTQRYTVIDATNNAKVEVQPVYYGEKPIKQSEAQNFVIETQGVKYQVIVSYKEHAKFITTKDKKECCGKLVVYKNDEKIYYSWI